MNLKEIKARCDAATEGPWTWQGVLLRRERLGPVIIGLDRDLDTLGTEKDVEFIAHAREDVPALIAEVEWLQPRLVRAHRMLLDDLAILYPDPDDLVEQLKAKLLHKIQDYLEEAGEDSP